MICNKCGYEIPDGSAFCLSCGAPVVSAPAVNMQTPELDIDLTTEDFNIQEVAPAVAAQPSAEQSAFNLNTQGTVKKKSKKVPILIGIGVILVALIVVVALNFNTWFAPDPRAQLNDALKTGVSAAFDDLEAKPVLNLSVSEPVAMEGSMELVINDSILQALAQNMDMDEEVLALLKGISIEYQTVQDDYVSSVSGTLQLQGSDIVTMQMITDAMTGGQWISFPELNSQALCLNPGYSNQISQMWETLLSSMSASKVHLKPIALRYTELFVNGLSSVERGSETITVDGVSENLTVLKCRLTGTDAIKMLSKMLETMKTDEDIRAIVMDLGQWAADEMDAGMTAEEIYEEFLESLDTAIQEINDLSSSDGLDEAISFDIFLSGKKLAGLRFAIPDATYQLLFAVVKNGSEFGVKLEFGPMVITGSGKDNGTDGISGEFTLSAQGMEMLIVSLDDYIVSDSEVSGSITLRFGKDMLEMMAQEMDPSMGSALSMLSPALRIDVNSTEDRMEGTIALNLSGLDVISIEMDGETVTPPAITIPESYISVDDEEALEQWMEESGLEDLMDMLEGVGIPAGGYDDSYI